jgi:hypothetical protein
MLGQITLGRYRHPSVSGVASLCVAVLGLAVRVGSVVASTVRTSEASPHVVLDG